MTKTLQRRAGKVDELRRALNAVSPLATLQRGYAILLDADSGAVVKSVVQGRASTRFIVRVADGQIALRRDNGH